MIQWVMVLVYDDDMRVLMRSDGGEDRVEEHVPLKEGREGVELSKIHGVICKDRVESRGLKISRGAYKGKRWDKVEK